MATVDMTSLKILVIDDEAFMRQLIVRVLKDLGAGGVHEAGNGSEALKQLTERSNDLDLVICDLEMPTMDGFEFVQELRVKIVHIINKTAPFGHFFPRRRLKIFQNTPIPAILGNLRDTILTCF